MLCLSLTPARLEDILNSDIRLADCVEVRLDYLNTPQIAQEFSWNRIDRPVIVACRRVERGGRFQGSAEEELQILKSAVRNGAAFMDLDYRDAKAFAGAKVIGSYHDFSQTPADIARHLEGACANPVVDIGKVATTVSSWNDNHTLMNLLRQCWAKPVIVIGMGDMGQITRVVGPARGSHWTYATTTQPSGESAAPGQIAADDLVHRYRYRRIRETTKLFGVVGNPVTHSRGYILHNHAFEAAGLDCAYMKFPVTDVGDFFKNAFALGIRGFSVTMPHKLAVIPFLSDMTAAAREAGAVNTVFHSNEGWIGDNTDVYGAGAALASAGFDPAGKRVVILGAGGAAKAAAVAVREAREIIILRRSEVSGGGEYNCDILINATPVGMAPDIHAAPISGTIRADIVFDMVYTPGNTQLLRLAKQQGKQTIAGTEMFYAQAARQFEIWSGRPAPADIYGAEALA